MEKIDGTASVNDAIWLYKQAKFLESEGSYERAKLKYQLAARILVELVGKTDQSDEKYVEYKSLAKEILTKAEKLKEKSSEELKEKKKSKTDLDIDNYLSHKDLRKPDSYLSKSVSYRKPTVNYVTSNKGPRPSAAIGKSMTMYK